MVPAVCASVGCEHLTCFVNLPCTLQVCFKRLAVIIGVHKIIACVVGRVNVDHLHPARITLLQEFEHFEVVTFDKEVVGVLFINALAGLGDESSF